MLKDFAIWLWGKYELKKKRISIGFLRHGCPQNAEEEYDYDKEDEDILDHNIVGCTP